MNNSTRYVLMVDDDRDDIVFMQEAFRIKKITERLESVRSGIALLNYLQTNPDRSTWPQIILLDLNMPEMTGLETLAKLKEHDILKSIPVIIYSTASDDNEIRHCYQLGANSYVVKPVGFENLLHTVDMIHAYWCKTATVVF